MSGDVMLFPATVEEFIEQYKVVDRDHAISNGAEFVPVFRMKQWFDHLQAQPITHADRIRAMSDEELAEWHKQMMEGYCPRPTSECPSDCYQCWLDWLRQEADNGQN